VVTDADDDDDDDDDNNDADNAGRHSTTTRATYRIANKTKRLQRTA